MVGPKISRKGDFETLEQILNSNEYWPNKVTSQFDKNFFFYVVQVGPTDENLEKRLKDESYEPISGVSIGEDEGIKLRKAGFVIIDTRISLHYIDKGTTGWGYDGSTPLGKLYAKLVLVLVREIEYHRFIEKNWRANNP